MTECKNIMQFYNPATNNCDGCDKLCYLHELQGTTKDCETHCADYLESIRNAPSTSLATTSIAPTPGLDVFRHQPWLIGLIVAIAVTVICALILCLCRKRLKKCFKRCPPIHKPPEAEVVIEMGLDRRGVAPADDGQAERDRLAIDGQNPHPIQKRDEPQDCQTEDEVGQSERSPMMSGPAAGSDLRVATSRPRDEMLYS